MQKTISKMDLLSRTDVLLIKGSCSNQVFLCGEGKERERESLCNLSTFQIEDVFKLKCVYKCEVWYVKIGSRGEYFGPRWMRMGSDGRFTMRNFIVFTVYLI